jgi:TfoX/Sxy family transcriptional regulator of competence genes
MAYSEELAERVRIVLAPAGPEERRMFGGLAFMVSGHMCCGIVGEKLMLRLAPDQAERAITQAQVQPMEMAGRTMRGFVLVHPRGMETDAALRTWIGQAQDFVSTLPKK